MGTELCVPDEPSFIDWYRQVALPPLAETCGGEKIYSIAADSLALVSLYNTSGGQNWLPQEGWLEAPLSDWDGVTLKEGRVSKLILNGFGLKGRLPPSLGQLSELVSLGLGSNHLTGSIPDDLGNLSSAVSIDLSDNELSGSIPESMGRLASLRQLNVGFNPLSGPLPASFTNLSDSLILITKGTDLCVPTDDAFMSWFLNIRSRSTIADCDGAIVTSSPDDNLEVVPHDFSLGQNYPNPFSATTTIEYLVPEPTSVTIVLLDLMGRATQTIVSRLHSPGTYTVTIDAAGLSDGVYLARMTAGSFHRSIKLTVAK